MSCIVIGGIRLGILQKKKRLSELEYGDHVCMLFDDIQDYKYIAINCAIDGLLNNEKVVLIIDEYYDELLIEDLRKENIDVERYIGLGQLVISNINNIYVDNNSFVPQKAINNINKLLLESKKENFDGIRIIGEMLFITKNEHDGFETLIEYETLVHSEVIKTYKNQIGICVFNKSKFPDYVLENIIKKHNVVINGTKITKPNPFYINFEEQLYEYNQRMDLRKQFLLRPNINNSSKVSDIEEKNKNIEILKYVLSGTGDGVWEWDISRSKIELSESFYELTGLTKDKLNYNPTNLYKLIHHDDWQELINVITKCCKNGLSYFDHALRVKNIKDDWVWLLVKGVPINKDAASGRVLKMVGIFNNINESKKLKRELEEKTHFEKLRSDFFANLSHEFRTPLNIILGSIQLEELYIRNDFKDTDSIIHKYSRVIKSMKQNCFRLLRLVNNLIDITKIDAGFYNVELENYDLISLLNSIVLSVQDYIRKQNLTIECTSNVSNLIIACDPEKIERIMLNLISNAIKFTEDGGKITVNINKNDTEVIIIVEDTGIGIPEDKISDIFNRFVQVDKSLVRSQEGSGIGLSLVKSLVELHGGAITVESESGKGTRFMFYIPIRFLDNENNIKKNRDLRRTANVESMHIEFSDIYSDD